MKYIKPLVINESNAMFDIPDIIWKLNTIFNKYGYKLYVVGGAVRDFITGDSPKDFDLCTDAIPDDVLQMLKPHYKVQLQGEAFGVVVVFPPEVPEGIEIATFREDITKGRNPEVRIGGVTIEQDVLRRDLTFNALFFDLETREIVDLVGGQEDLKNKIVRMVGEPMERIEEDPLRILRVFRFASRYGSKLDKNTAKAIHKHNDISQVSKERIWDSANGEFMKSYKQAIDFQQYLDFITEFKLWDQILPGLKVTPKIISSYSIELVLAQILIENDTDLIREVLSKCAVSGEITNKVIFFHKILDFKTENVLSFYKLKKRYKVDQTSLEIWLNINNVQDYNILKFIHFTPSVNSKEVMDEYGIKPGPELGKKIEELEIQKFKEMK